MPASPIRSIEVQSLHFDLLNPRIPASRRSQGPEAILNYMIDNENIVDLIASIGEQGFFPGEPLLVVGTKSSPEAYDVVEGNRRLAALKLLNNPDLATSKRGTISQLVAEADHHPVEVEAIEFTDRNEILDYLGYRHITGVDDWDSLQKARYLQQLADRHRSEYPDPNNLYRHLAKLIGSRSDYVRKLLIGFNLYSGIESNEFYGIPGLSEETFSFSLLTTAMSYSNISDFVGIESDESSSGVNDTNLQLLVDWMFRENSENQTRIPESRSLKTLNAVVANDTARTAFIDGRTLEEAGLLTNEPRENFHKLVEQAYNRLQLAQDSVHHISQFEESDIRLCENTKNLARTIYNMVITQGEE